MSDTGSPGTGQGWGPAGPAGPPAGFPPGPPPPPGYGYGYPPPAPRTNVLAVLGLVFAFVFWPAGIVLSAIALGQVRRRREGGHGLALAGLVVSLVAGVVAVVLVVGLVVTGAGRSGGSAAATSPPAAATAGGPGTGGGSPGTVSCDWTADTSGNPELEDVGLPPDPVPGQGTPVLRMATNRGVLTLTLDRRRAPCASASFVHLARQRFFDGSSCHRQVDQPTFGVLQCGDPSGTGSGGPTYRYRQETTAGTTYPRGTIAMANTGQPDSTGSQFFLCFTDTQLAPDYTVVGTVDQAGLAVLDGVAAAGDDGSFDPSPGGGRPNLPVTVTSMTVVRG